MKCRVSRYKISHLSLNLLLHYLAKLKCSKYIRLQLLFNSKVVYPLSTVNIYERWYVFIHVCMQINCSMFLNCLLLASTRALSRARSVSMDALMTRYSMLSEAFSRRWRKISHWHQMTATAFKNRTSKLMINISNKLLVNLSSWTEIKFKRRADYFGQYTMSYECTVEHSTFTR